MIYYLIYNILRNVYFPQDYCLKPESATNTNTIGTLSIPSSITSNLNRTITLAIAVADMPLGTPAIVVGVARTTSKDTGSSPRRKVVRQVERRHSKGSVKGFKDFYNIRQENILKYFSPINNNNIDALSSFIVIIYIA